MDHLTDNLPLVSACAAGLVGLFITWKFSKGTKSSDPIVAPQGTVVLRQIPRGLRAPSLSPFPLKLETFLRLAKVPYINDFSNKRSSKGKTPWMTYDGVDVADSQLCIKYLKEKRNIDVNRNLTSQQKAVSLALQVLVDEHLYWIIAYYRWVHDKEKAVLRKHFKSAGFLSSILLSIFERKVRNMCHGQGMGRHSPEEIYHFLLEDLNTLQTYLGDKPFMMGDEMTEVDCSVFGMLCQFIYHSDDKVLKDLVKDQYPKLLTYVERIKALIWPDWDDCLNKDL